MSVLMLVLLGNGVVPVVGAKVESMVGNVQSVTHQKKLFFSQVVHFDFILTTFTTTPLVF